MWSIRVLSGQQAGQVFDLKIGKNVFGRGGVSNVKIQSLGISKEHCEIHVYKDKMMIIDLKSSNGTFVNGVKIQNSILRVGDKVSLFDVIMDVIPTPDIRPKTPAPRAAQTTATLPSVPSASGQGQMVAPMGAQMNPNYPAQFQQQGNLAMQMNYQQTPPLYQNASSSDSLQKPLAPQKSFQEKVEDYIENVVMPVIYKLGIVFSFRQILMGFVVALVFMVTLLSTVPLTNIIKESNLDEAIKRARSVARAVAKYNEQFLMTNQLGSLTVAEALKEEGIKDAFIVQQSDGQIIAPPEKVGRAESNELILTVRKDPRAAYKKIDANTIGASFPVAVYDPASGEATPKYHAVVMYDIGSLNVDTDRVVSLFMQVLVLASILALILYFLFVRLIEYPIRSLNSQINKALIDKTDRTEVVFDYPVFQQLVSNVNTILNRAWSGESADNMGSKPQQNKDIEFSNLVEMISHPVIVVDNQQRVVALNVNFEQLAQVSRDSILNQSYQTIPDAALVQNMDSLLARSTQSPYEKQIDKIPFAQFECEIFCQAFLNPEGEPQYFVMTLVQVSEG